MYRLRIIYRLFIILLLLTGCFNAVQAKHIIGGDLTYECMGGNQYKIRLVLFRDCEDSEAAPFDDPVYIYIADAQSGNWVNVDGEHYIEIELDEDIDIEPDFSDICAGTEPELCIERGTYEKTINLPPRATGYKLIYQRCCRNNSIDNINAPESTGATYETVIMHTDNTCDNSSPTFNTYPPIVICADYPLVFDHSASDIDGDSLYYEVCTPFDGATPNCPQPRPDNPDCDTPYDYEQVVYQTGYSINNVLGGSPPLTIDPTTGLLNAFPDEVGKYVVGICVKEYRNGELIGTTLRDFQFNVTDCDIVSASVANAIQIGVGQFQLISCEGLLVNFENTSIGATQYYWDFGDPTSNTDISNAVNPSYLYPDTGKYEVMLIANPQSTCRDTAIIYLGVYPTFDPAFSFSDSLCKSEPFSFSDETFSTYGFVNSWYWDFDDGTTIGVGYNAAEAINVANTSGTFANPIHYFPDNGIYDVTMVTSSDYGCRDTVRHQIYVNNSGTAAFSIQNVCFGEPVVFDATESQGDITSFSWNFDDPATGAQNTAIGTTATHTFSNTGFFDVSLYIETATDCPDTLTQLIGIFPPLSIATVSSPEICEGGVLNLTLPVSGGNETGNTYHWEPANLITQPDSLNTTTLPLNTSQVFTLSVTDPNGCQKTATLPVTVHTKPTINIGNDTTICLGASTILTATGNFSSLEWTDTDGNELNSNTVLPTDTTLYIANALSPEGCLQTDTIQINIIPDLSVVTIPQDMSICKGDTVQLAAAGALNYEWSPQNTLNDATVANPLVFPIQTTTYNIVFSNEGCFERTESVTITVLPTPYIDAGPNATINIGESVQLQGSSNYGYLWTPALYLSDNTVYNPLATPLENTVYTLTATSDEGCEAQDSVTVEVTRFYDIWAPTAFSPNNDQVNDVWRFFSRGIEDILEVKIYNRWGNLVYDGSGFDSYWDGFYRGVLQDMGVYVYYIRAKKYAEGEMIVKGNITLVR